MRVAEGTWRGWGLSAFSYHTPRLPFAQRTHEEKRDSKKKRGKDPGHNPPNVFLLVLANTLLRKEFVLAPVLPVYYAVPPSSLPVLPMLGMKNE